MRGFWESAKQKKEQEKGGEEGDMGGSGTRWRHGSMEGVAGANKNSIQEKSVLLPKMKLLS